MQRFFSRQFLLADTTLLAGIALFKLLLHFATNTALLGYGLFGDEFYYWVCALRLDWGYVDHPPLAPFLLSINRLLLGDSMFAMRVLPAIAGAALVILTGLMVRELGGGKFAQCLAALAVTFAPVHLVLDSFFSMNAFEVLWWALCSYLLIVLLKNDRPRLWLWIGAVAGIGLQTKHTMVMFGVGLLVGLLLTPARKYFLSKWLWLGGLVALLIFLPNIVWEIQRGWPTLEFYANAEFYKNAPTPPVSLILYQILAMNPLALPIWLAGLCFFFFAPAGKPYRALGWIYATVLLALMAAQSSRPDRIAGAYPMLLAAGAPVIERLAARPNWRWVAAGSVAAAVIGGVALLPFSLPVLPPDLTTQYLETLGLSIRLSRGEQPPLPPYLANRLGWQEMAAAVAEVYRDLPPEDQAQATIVAPYYAVAGAIEYYGGEYDLPRTVSGHNNYYLWGYGDASGEVVIAIGGTHAEWREFFRQVAQVATTQCQHCEADGLPVYVARGLKVPLQEIWPRIKHYE